MNRKAFTLVELLAVIVILAIIALIAVPIVINIINDSKGESQKRSIDGYARALKQASADYQIKNSKEVFGRFRTTDGKVLTKDDISLNVTYKGNVICDNIILNKNGTIYLSECTVDGTKVDYEYGETTYGMIMENEAHSSKFLNTGIEGYRISTFKLENKLDIENKDNYQKADCSYNQDESVICYFKELPDKPGYYDVVLASDGEMYTPVNSSYLFYQLGWQSNKYFELDLEGLNTKYTTNMSHMFDTVAFYIKSLNLGNKFDTSNVTNMSYMFSNAFKAGPNGNTNSFSFTFPDSFDTSNVTNMSHMFAGGFYSNVLLDLGNNFDTSKVTDMSGMFKSSFYMSKLVLGSKFDTSNVTNMSHMFDGTVRHMMRSFSLGDKFDTSKVTDMSSMFSGLGGYYLTELDLGDKFDTGNVTNMSNMFNGTGYEKMEELDLGNNFNTSNVTDMSNMFSGLSNLKTLILGDKFDTSNVTNMNNMFNYFGHDMENFSLGNKFNTSNVTSMSDMFSGAFKNKLKKLDLGNNFNTSNVKLMSSMFKETGYEAMEELDLGSNFDTSNVYSMDSMFKNTGYKKLEELDLGDKFIRGNKYNYYEYYFDYMFEGTGHNSMHTLNLRNFQFYKSYNYNRDNIFKDCGTEGVLTKVIVFNNDLKTNLMSLTSPKDIPEFWKNNNIIEVQSD